MSRTTAEQTVNKPKIRLGSPTRVGVVVRDARATAQTLWSYFGIGPFLFESWPAAEGPGFMSYWRDCRARWTMTLARANLGSLELQLIQPLNGPSHYAAWLAERGEGLHHLAFDVDDLDGAERELTRAGIHVACGASDYSTGASWMLANTEPLLGWNMELDRCSSFQARGTLANTLHETPGREHSSAQPCISVGRLVQVGIVTCDAQREADLLSSLFGIGPFQFTDWPGDCAGRRGYFRGQPSHFGMRLGFRDLGGIQLELIQPVEGESVYTEFLARRGPGIHHLLFDVPDLEEEVVRLATAGVAVRMSGSGLVAGTRWLYLDTEHLVGWSLELRGRPRDNSPAHT